MVSEEGLVDWALEHSSELSLRAEHYAWTESLLPGYKDLSIQVKIGGRQYSGRGTANTEELAFSKAFSEAVERSVLSHYGLRTSNGVAAHIDRQRAELAAKYELIERDWFLSHFLSHTPISPLRTLEALPVLIQSAFSKLKNHGVEVKFYTNHFQNNYTAVACVAEVGPVWSGGGYILGLGCSSDPHSAYESAFLECVRNVFALKEGVLKPSLSQSDFLNQTTWGPEHHGRLRRDPEFSLCLKKYLNQSTSDSNDQGLNLEEIQFENLPIPHPELKGVPLFVCRAYSPKAQDLFFGPATAKVLNWGRLCQVSGRELTMDDIQPLSHPLS